VRAAVLTAALVSACGPSSYGDFRDQLVGRACTRAVRCGLVGASERVRCGVPAALALTDAGPLDVATAVDAGRLRFDSYAAAGCLDAMEGAPCDDVAAARHLVRHCHAVITPHVATGSACDTDEECLGGRCVRDGAACRGTCVAFASPGGACLPDGGAPPQTCDPTVQYCDDGLSCQRHKAPGQACTADEQCGFALVCRKTCVPLPLAARGQSCSDDAPCGDGLRCRAGACEALGAGGAICGDAAACQDGLTCVGLSTSSTGTCRPWRDLGQSCVTGSDGSGCPASQRCDDATAVCVAVPATEAGPRQSCRALPCGNRLYCASVSGTCQYRAGLRGACRVDEPDACSDGLACDPQRLVCARASCG
jgi:hypothetical protein